MPGNGSAGIPGLKDAAAQLTQVPETVLDQVMEESRAERLRLQQETALG
jgi:hypothetical protein